MFHIVLFQPQIPQNTGNISRTCAVTGSVLHLIEPLGFSIDDKKLKRAGLDYWQDLCIRKYSDFYQFLLENNHADIYLITTKGSKNYTDFDFKDNSYFIFGSETSGLPQEIHDMYPNNRLRIPMLSNEHARCLNLSNAVSVVLFEALRQTDFLGLQ